MQEVVGELGGARLRQPLADLPSLLRFFVAIRKEAAKAVETTRKSLILVAEPESDPTAPTSKGLPV
jgi:hypothetical protein